MWDLLNWQQEGTYTPYGPPSDYVSSGELADIGGGGGGGEPTQALSYSNLGQKSMLDYLGGMYESARGREHDLPEDVSTFHERKMNVWNWLSPKTQRFLGGSGAGDVGDWVTTPGAMDEGAYYGLGFGTEEGISGGKWADRGEDYMSMGDFLSLAGEDTSWINMNKDELSDFASGILSEEYGGDIKFDKNALEALQMLAEGTKAIRSPEKFGLGRKLADIEGTGKRAIESARQTYVPGETLTRYGGLQGKPSAGEAGEALEQKYLTDVFGEQRKIGKGVRGVYGDYKDSTMDAIMSWLQYV